MAASVALFIFYSGSLYSKLTTYSFQFNLCMSHDKDAGGWLLRICHNCLGAKVQSLLDIWPPHLPLFYLLSLCPVFIIFLTHYFIFPLTSTLVRVAIKKLQEVFRKFSQDFLRGFKVCYCCDSPARSCLTNNIYKKVDILHISNGPKMINKIV